MIQLAAAIAGLGAITKAGANLYAGQVASTEAKFNARLKEKEAGFISDMMGIQWFQDTRMVNRAISTAVQTTAKSGMEFSGSPLAATMDMATQMEFDKLINQWNLDYKREEAEAQKEAYYKQASVAKKMGWMNAMSSALYSASSFGIGGK